ncbi:MAG: anaerobic sulfatase maturase [Deltaproteobacteria bacterium]|nr:anaerobic sulfatase maturase [Deltaproteobacteria bacterium]
MTESTKRSNQTQQGIHIVAKPIGPKCNLNCDYCFYLEKQALFPKGEDYMMPDEVLQAYITKYITLQPTPVVGFVWQGGEPTLLGLDFYKRVVELQRPYAGQKEITNSLQTNGTLLDDEWCAFLKENNFLVGLSLDGPKEIHDRYRKDRGGKGSFDKVMRGLKLLQKHGVEYNVMATVARETTYKPLEVYRFFKDQNVEFIQFAPVIERVAGAEEQELGLKLAGYSSLSADQENSQVTDWSVVPEAYGDFLIAVFDEWIRNDVGTTNVMNFEWALNSWIGNSSPVCQFAQSCGKAIMLEHNGDLYACDHSMYPEFKLGNIVNDNPVRLAENSVAKGFGVKDANLPVSCQECDVLKACWGGCPKHRFARTWNDEPVYYLCEGYKKYFSYIKKYLHGITQLLENGLPASQIMKACKGPLVIKLKNEN